MLSIALTFTLIPPVPVPVADDPPDAVGAVLVQPADRTRIARTITIRTGIQRFMAVLLSMITDIVLLSGITATEKP